MPEDGRTRSKKAGSPLTAAAAAPDKVDKVEERELIVGIGASAGGLGAFTTFLSTMPVDSGMAFILVQHLSPEHKSILTTC